MNEQAPQTPEVPSDMLAVTDLDQFIALLTDWHTRQVKTVTHLQHVPQGIKVLIGGDDGEAPEEKILEGEFLEGFQMGLGLALNYLGTLPFMAEYADDTPAVH